MYVYDAASRRLLTAIPNPIPVDVDNFGASLAVADDRVVVTGFTGIDGQLGKDFVFALNANETIRTPNGLEFDIQTVGDGAGQLAEASGDALDGLNRLQVLNTYFAPFASGPTIWQDLNQTITTPQQAISSFDVHREITVPNTGRFGFARTLDVFENPSDGSITTTVRIVGNLGSDAQTTVVATSDGDLEIEPTDQWFITDDAIDGGGTPSVVHYLHGAAQSGSFDGPSDRGQSGVDV